mgnify:CR=1 FL=1
MIYLKTEEEIELLRRSNDLLGRTLAEIAKVIRPGVTTADLDKVAYEFICDNGGKPSCLGYEGFPATLCTSVNEQGVHGIPSDHVTVENGALLSIDCGLILDGWQADSAFTVGVGQISAEARQPIDVTEQCFFKAARASINGAHLGDIGHAVQQHAESFGYGVIRDLTGHGIGRNMHEDPSIPNFGRPGHGVRLRAGMTIAIEPMIAMGGYRVSQLDDGWTIVTDDGSICSHYEHTLAINEKGLPELLTFPGYVLTEEAE